MDYEDKLQLEEMDVSSTEESELESDTEAVNRLAYIFIDFHFSVSGAPVLLSIHFSLIIKWERFLA